MRYRTTILDRKMESEQKLQTRQVIPRGTLVTQPPSRTRSLRSMHTTYNYRLQLTGNSNNLLEAVRLATRSYCLFL